jgi:hypothetical protein
MRSYSVAKDSTHPGLGPVWRIAVKFTIIVLLALIVIGMEFFGLELMETPKYFI